MVTFGGESIENIDSHHHGALSALHAMPEIRHFSLSIGIQTLSSVQEEAVILH